MYGNINEIRKCFWSQEKRLAERAKKVMFPYTVGHFYTVLAMYMYIPFYYIPCAISDSAQNRSYLCNVVLDYWYHIVMSKKDVFQQFEKEVSHIHSSTVQNLTSILQV